MADAKHLLRHDPTCDCEKCLEECRLAVEADREARKQGKG